MSNSKKMGRPPLDIARTERIYVRVTKEEKEVIKSLASKKGLSISELILKGIEKMK